MTQVYKFQVIMPADTALPRDAYTNTLHFRHSIGALATTDLDSFGNSIAALYQLKFGGPSAKVQVKAYEEGPPPNPPVSDITKGTSLFTTGGPRELALCLSFAGNKSRPRERGRIYLPVAAMYSSFGQRPDSAQQNWALGFYSTPNASFPDLGGVDWQFGVWSPTNQAFVQAKEAWVDNEWDVVRSRGLQPSARVTSVRDG